MGDGEEERERWGKEKEGGLEWDEYRAICVFEEGYEYVDVEFLWKYVEFQRRIERKAGELMEDDGDEEWEDVDDEEEEVYELPG